MLLTISEAVTRLIQSRLLIKNLQKKVKSGPVAAFFV